MDVFMRLGFPQGGRREAEIVAFAFVTAASKRGESRAAGLQDYIQNHRRKKIVPKSITPIPQMEAHASQIIAMQMMDGPQTHEQLELAIGRYETQQFPALECLKSLDDLDQEEDEDDDELAEDDEDDLEDDDDLEDEDDDLEDEDDDDLDDDDEDEDEEEDEDGGVKPLKMG